MQDVGGHGGGFFVRNLHDHRNFGEGVSHALDVFVATVRFKQSEQIGMHADVRTVWNRERCQWSWFGVALLCFLTTRASSDVAGDIQLEGWPPPGSFDMVHGAFNGTVSSQDVAVSLM